MGESVAEAAVREAREIAKLARDSVRNEILDGMTPGIERLVEGVLRSRTRNLTEGERQMDDKEELGTESIAGMFAGLSEEEQEGGVHVDVGSHDLEEADVPYLDEMESLEGDLDEEIEIDEAELASRVAESIQLEVQMSKGMKDLDLSGKEEVDQGNAVHDVKSGEHYFDDIEPPAKKDWTMKEIKHLVAKGLKENEMLRGHVGRLQEMNKKLMEHLRRTNLFNAKMVEVNGIFAKHSLTKEQKRGVVESIDKAKTVSEAKNIANGVRRTLVSGKPAGKVQESRVGKPRANAARVTTPAADQRVIREEVDRNQGETQQLYGRWEELSGIVS